MERGPQNSPEKSPEEIVETNLKKMVTEMTEVLMGESFGGNAGFWVGEDGKKLPCAAVNGYIDKRTGEIITFDDDYSIEGFTREDKQSVGGVTFRIAIDFKGPSLIVNTFINETREVGPTAKAILENSATKYNDFIIQKYREQN